MTVSGDCILGRTDIVETEPIINAGVYIDISNPALCSGQITQWNLCYYNPREFANHTDILDIGLQVWRPDNQVEARILMLVDDHEASVDIPQKPDNFQCTSIELDQDEYTNITAGDFLGVRLSFAAVLPVVNSYQQPDPPAPMIVFEKVRLFSPSSIEIDRQSPEVALLTSHGIHVTADIGKFVHRLIIDTCSLQ